MSVICALLALPAKKQMVAAGGACAQCARAHLVKARDPQGQAKRAFSARRVTRFKAWAGRGSDAPNAGPRRWVGLSGPGGLSLKRRRPAARLRRANRRALSRGPRGGRGRSARKKSPGVAAGAWLQRAV